MLGGMMTEEDEDEVEQELAELEEETVKMGMPSVPNKEFPKVKSPERTRLDPQVEEDEEPEMAMLAQ